MTTVKEVSEKGQIRVGRKGSLRRFDVVQASNFSVWRVLESEGHDATMICVLKGTSPLKAGDRLQVIARRGLQPMKTGAP